MADKLKCPIPIDILKDCEGKGKGSLNCGFCLGTVAMAFATKGDGESVKKITGFVDALENQPSETICAHEIDEGGVDE